LFATEGYDLRALLRSGKTDLEISNAIAQICLPVQIATLNCAAHQS